jgi:hypothetical protein
MSIRTRRSLSLAAAAALLLGLAGSAAAQDTPEQPAAGAKAARPAKGAKATRVKVITIEEENVIGDVPTGQIIPVDARLFSKSPSLIRLRHSFVDKILESAQGL